MLQWYSRTRCLFPLWHLGLDYAETKQIHRKGNENASSPLCCPPEYLHDYHLQDVNGGREHFRLHAGSDIAFFMCLMCGTPKFSMRHRTHHSALRRLNATASSECVKLKRNSTLQFDDVQFTYVCSPPRASNGQPSLCFMTPMTARHFSEVSCDRYKVCFCIRYAHESEISNHLVDKLREVDVHPPLRPSFVRLFLI